MKTGLISFRNVRQPYACGVEKTVSDEFSTAGFFLDEITLLAEDDRLSFLNKLNEYKDVFDNVIVIESPNVDFSIKEAIAECMQVDLVDNDRAKKSVADYFAQKGLKPTINAEELSQLPEGATVLPNPVGYVQGYMMEDDDLSLIVLPGEENECKETCRQYVLPYMQSKFRLKYDCTTIKLFGADRVEVEAVIREAVKMTKRTVVFQLTENFADYKLDVIYNSKSPKMVVDDVLRFLLTELKKWIYAEENVSLERRVSEILKLRKKRLAVSESFTGGNVASRLIALSGASEFLYESVVAYDNGSKIKRLNVSPNTLQKHGAVSSETAYEMVAGLLAQGDVDVAVSTTGIAGPKSDNTQKPVGLCYIAVGTKDGVHVYQYKLNGDRNTITQTAVNAALYLTYKNVKEL